MTTYQQAKNAKEFLKTFLSSEFSVGVGKESDSYVVAVRVPQLTDKIRRIVPNEIDGVKVSVEEVGTIKSLTY